MTPADKLRCDLVAEVEHLRVVKAETDCALRVAEAKLVVHDLTVAVMTVPAEPAARTREKRRNIRAEVYRHLSGEPATVDALRAAIGRVKRDAVLDALQWHLGKGTAASFGKDGWGRPDLVSQAPMQAEAA